MTTDKLTARLREHMPLVRKVASEFAGRVPASVEMADLIQVGTIGLWQALERFDASMGLQLSTFAAQRIRGAMLDELRACDTMSRADRQLARALSVATIRLGHELGREPGLHELAQATGLSLEVCSRLQVPSSTVSLDDAKDAPSHQTPHEQCEQARLHADVAQAIGWLPERERLVVEQHVDEARTLAEIAQERGISESRACQIYQRAIKRLQIKLWAWRDSHALQAQPLG